MRLCPAETEAARCWSSQKPGSCISASRRPSCFSSAGGSKVVREQLQLVAEIAGAGGKLLTLKGVSHLRPVTFLVFLPGATPARIVAPDLLALVDLARLDLRERGILLGAFGLSGDAGRHAGHLGC